MAKSHLYKIIFLNQGKVFEIYARSVGQGALFGFVEVEELVFGERTTVVVDPSEERLKSEFETVKRIFEMRHTENIPISPCMQSSASMRLRSRGQARSVQLMVPTSPSSPCRFTVLASRVAKADFFIDRDHFLTYAYLASARFPGAI